MTDARRRLGARAEQLVADHYTAAGYTIESRNFRCPAGEIDLIAARGELLVFIEVRSTTTDYLDSPTRTVAPAKQRRIALTADRYLAARAHAPRDIRFDVVGVRFDRSGERGRGAARLQPIENAFTPPWAF